MDLDIEIPFDLEMCIKGVCTPLKIPINSDFKISSLEVDSSGSPLSHACKINIKFGNEIVYNGMMGNDGFVLTIMDIDEEADFEISLFTDCSLLVDLTEVIDPIKVILKGAITEKQTFNTSFKDDWS
tara:strand:+ start:148 stop:528 length:381 start_codon:yes stop_codon:yes gene_type:complete